MILACDVGATKTLLALYEEGASPHRPLLEARRSSRDAPSLDTLVREFLAGTGAAHPRHAVIGIAGPVVNNRSEATNLAGPGLDRAFGAAQSPQLAAARLERRPAGSVRAGNAGAGRGAALRMGTA